MTIAILGTGKMGRGLANRLSGKVDVVLGSRDPQKKAAVIAETSVPVRNYQDAVAEADIVVLAMPIDASIATARALDLGGKVVVDISNPIKPDMSGLKYDRDTSGAEEIQKAAPDAQVVKAFNTIFSSMFEAPTGEIGRVPVFIAGNDKAAVDKVAGLAHSAGFAVENVGGLDGARLLEPVGLLNIRLAFGQGRGTAIAPAWMKIAA